MRQKMLKNYDLNDSHVRGILYNIDYASKYRSHPLVKQFYNAVEAARRGEEYGRRFLMHETQFALPTLKLKNCKELMNWTEGKISPPVKRFTSLTPDGEDSVAAKMAAIFFGGLNVPASYCNDNNRQTSRRR